MEILRDNDDLLAQALEVFSTLPPDKQEEIISFLASLTSA